jgi:hypothetical protein
MSIYLSLFLRFLQCYSFQTSLFGIAMHDLTQLIQHLQDIKPKVTHSLFTSALDYFVAALNQRLSAGEEACSLVEPIQFQVRPLEPWLNDIVRSLEQVDALTAGIPGASHEETIRLIISLKNNGIV